MAGPTLRALAEGLKTGRVTARALVEECLEKIAEPQGQGSTAFIAVDADGARTAADAVDAMRKVGAEPSALAGIPVSIKDLFDVRGQVTRAGSLALDHGPAPADAAAVARLRRAGMILIGRTNMTEFAFSGLGLNPHYGTPLSPWRREEARIAGGSTSGGAVSVADGMAHAALGSDTGGSCRIPAAWCGLTGFKPSWGRVPTKGTVPLSTTLDVAGPIARTVDCCAILDAVLTGSDNPVSATSLVGRRFLAPTNYVLDGVDDHVAPAFEAALTRLSDAGAVIDARPFEVLDTIPGINAKGGFAAAEAWAWHRKLIEEKGDAYDPRVLVRIRRGAEQGAADYVDLLAARARLISDFEVELADYDAMLAPTTPIAPPQLAALNDDSEYGRINLLALRNPTAINMADGCAISIPVHREGEALVGLMIASTRSDDQRLLALASAVEKLFSR